MFRHILKNKRDQTLISLLRAPFLPKTSHFSFISHRTGKGFESTSPRYDRGCDSCRDFGCGANVENCLGFPLCWKRWASVLFWVRAI
ncbi:hypothetical protein ES332_D13G167500v1 [Gossypium tomentosum]|uniref:Uncharacterized protein n=1 Tax=Gossypium tomentosum TaxID=34277 RepID=A0A5D2HZX3_GOSTO|nr:hypothetical protein ES332_D13G167500v1 [Gossypium tomentosum]